MNAQERIDSKIDMSISQTYLYLSEYTLYKFLSPDLIDSSQSTPSLIGPDYCIRPSTSSCYTQSTKYSSRQQVAAMPPPPQPNLPIASYITNAFFLHKPV